MFEESESSSFISTQPGPTTISGESEDVRRRSIRSRCDTSEKEGIEVLDTVTGLVVTQRVDLLEVFTSIDMNNRYDVRAPTGDQLFFAYEKSPCLIRCCMGKRHGFIMHVIDNNGKEILSIKRKCKFCCCISNEFAKLCACCNCCKEFISVESPPGNEIGSVDQTCGTKLKFDVFDGNERIANVVGPSYCGMGCCTCCSPRKVFTIHSNDGEQVGVIIKKFGGVFKELFTNADVFHVKFPVDMSVQGKALLLSTVFLIDYVAFEDTN
ncbi:hypothetical protein RB195_004587 [Necator americanus]|uniref:Phospholipid scramblase n=1 Tax=Necator americanus TaxID=51031 RepID=A0ABR1BIR0_NECAM